MSKALSMIVPPPPVIAFAGWVFPGLGYWLIGQRQRAVIIGVTIILLFVLGLLIGGIRVVDPPDLSGPGNLLGRILQKPWFMGQFLTGPLGLVTAWMGLRLELPASTARVWDIGTLYTAVAGMLNLLAIIDAAHRAGQVEGRA